MKRQRIPSECVICMNFHVFSLIQCEKKQKHSEIITKFSFFRCLIGTNLSESLNNCENQPLNYFNIKKKKSYKSNKKKLHKIIFTFKKY